MRCDMIHHTCEYAFMFFCSLLRVNAVFLSKNSQCCWCWIGAKAGVGLVLITGGEKKRQIGETSELFLDLFRVLLFIPQAAGASYSATATHQCLQAVSAIHRVHKLLALALVSASRIIEVFLIRGIRFVFGRWKRRQMPCRVPSGRDKVFQGVTRQGPCPAGSAGSGQGCAPALPALRPPLAPPALPAAALFPSCRCFTQGIYLKPAKRASHMDRLCQIQL